MGFCKGCGLFRRVSPGEAQQGGSRGRHTLGPRVAMNVKPWHSPARSLGGGASLRGGRAAAPFREDDRLRRGTMRSLVRGAAPAGRAVRSLGCAISEEERITVSSRKLLPSTTRNGRSAYLRGGPVWPLCHPARNLGFGKALGVDLAVSLTADFLSSVNRSR